MRQAAWYVTVAVLCVLVTTQSFAAGPVERAANLLVVRQLSTGDWGEGGFAGEAVIGLVSAYKQVGAPGYKTSAEAGGAFILSSAGYDASTNTYALSTYAAEAYALARLSELAATPSDNNWRTALEDLFDEIRARSGSTEDFIGDLVVSYGAVYLGTAVYDVSRFTAAAAYVGDADVAAWRAGLIELLGDVDDTSNAPTTALGAATWALEVSGGLDSTVVSGGSAFLNGKMLSELPDLLAAQLQVANGSFTWNFDGSYPGFTEATVMAALALDVVGGYDTAVNAAIALLRQGVDAKGVSYFEIGVDSSPASFYYSGETLEIIREVGEQTFVRGDSNADASIDIADVVFVLEYLFAQGNVPLCEDTADSNDDGWIDIADPVFMLNYLYGDGTAPVAPFATCGVDLTPDALGCDAYPPCF